MWNWVPEAIIMRDGQLQDTMLTVPYDFCVDVPISRLLTVGAEVAAFNQEKALVGAFSMIVKTDCETDGSSTLYSTSE